MLLLVARGLQYHPLWGPLSFGTQDMSVSLGENLLMILLGLFVGFLILNTPNTTSKQYLNIYLLLYSQ